MSDKYRVKPSLNKRKNFDSRREQQLSVLYNHYFEKKESLSPVALNSLRNAIARLGGNL